MTKKHHLSRWSVFALCVAAACGGDSGSSGVVTGLPSEQKLTTLTDDEVKKACQSVNDGAAAVITKDALKRAVCVPLAVEAAVTYSNDQETVDVNKCQQIVDTCVSSSDDEDDVDDTLNDDDDDDDCERASAKDVQGCEATVGEYEACINQVLGEMQRRLSELTCQNGEQLRSEEYSNDELDASKLPQCQTLVNKCAGASLGIPFVD